MMMCYELLARLVEYPGPDLSGAVDDCIAALAPEFPESADLLRQFRVSLRELACGRLEEIYTQTFDLEADGSLYIGHQLFGEDYRRSLFMARLRHRYRELGFSCETEMPDHLAMALRYLAAAEPGPDADELIRECVMPAVSKILRVIERKDGPYRSVVEALLLFFRRQGDGQFENEDYLCRPFSSSLFPILP